MLKAGSGKCLFLSPSLCSMGKTVKEDSPEGGRGRERERESEREKQVEKQGGKEEEALLSFLPV